MEVCVYVCVSHLPEFWGQFWLSHFTFLCIHSHKESDPKSAEWIPGGKSRPGTTPAHPRNAHEPQPPAANSPISSPRSWGRGLHPTSWSSTRVHAFPSSPLMIAGFGMNGENLELKAVGERINFCHSCHVIGGTASALSPLCNSSPPSLRPSCSCSLPQHFPHQD